MTRHVATEIDSEDVAFDPEEIAAAWEDFNDGDEGGIPAEAAAAIIVEWYDDSVTAADAVESDRDVLFPDAEIMVEERAMGVCDRRTAEDLAGAFIDLNREDDHVLALNGAAVYEDWTVPEPLCDEHEPEASSGEVTA